MQQFSEVKDDVADIKIKVISVEDQKSRQMSRIYSPTKELSSILQQFSQIKEDVADIKAKVNTVEDQNSKQISNLVEKKIKDLGKSL